MLSSASPDQYTRMGKSILVVYPQMQHIPVRLQSRDLQVHLSSESDRRQVRAGAMRGLPQRMNSSRCSEDGATRLPQIAASKQEVT
jgi:hypothetical protein